METASRRPPRRRARRGRGAALPPRVRGLRRNHSSRASSSRRPPGGVYAYASRTRSTARKPRRSYSRRAPRFRASTPSSRATKPRARASRSAASRRSVPSPAPRSRGTTRSAQTKHAPAAARRVRSSHAWATGHPPTSATSITTSPRRCRSNAAAMSSRWCRNAPCHSSAGRSPRAQRRMTPRTFASNSCRATSLAPTPRPPALRVHTAQPSGDGARRETIAAWAFVSRRSGARCSTPAGGQVGMTTPAPRGARRDRARAGPGAATDR